MILLSVNLLGLSDHLILLGESRVLFNDLFHRGFMFACGCQNLIFLLLRKMLRTARFEIALYDMGIFFDLGLIWFELPWEWLPPILEGGPVSLRPHGLAFDLILTLLQGLQHAIRASLMLGFDFGHDV